MIRFALIAALTVALTAPARAQNLIHAFLAPAPIRSVYVNPSSVGKPFPGARARGILAFRGNPTRSWYGTGPLPRNPRVLWKRGTFCGPSTDEQGTRQWCGTGWTGQPVIRADTTPVEVIFGAYDHQVHFLDAATGKDIRAPFRTGDIIKGSVSLDPSGAPFLYTGSRDNYLRALRLDAEHATEVWKLSSISGDGVWNNDWDGNPLILGDYLLTGSENSWFYAVALNRGTDPLGRASIAPKVVNRVPGFTPELFRAIGDRMVSIETSAMAVGDRVYFTNSGGLVQGYSIPKLLAGATREAALTFEFQTGDDADATLVADARGMIYSAIEDERRDSPAKNVSGQLVKLDPAKPGDPVVWSLRIPGRIGGKGGIWATPAIHLGHLYVPTHKGSLLTVNAETGIVTSDLAMPSHGWSSPTVIDHELLVADCDGALSKFSLADPAKPQLVWRYDVPGAGCWESTPAIWDGVIYLGNRDGYFYAIAEAATAPEMLTHVDIQ